MLINTTVVKSYLPFSCQLLVCWTGGEESSLKYYQTKMEQQSGVPLTSVDEGSTQTDNQGDNARANNKIRTRALLTTELAYRESPMQAISDVALANELNFRAP